MFIYPNDTTILGDMVERLKDAMIPVFREAFNSNSFWKSYVQYWINPKTHEPSKNIQVIIDNILEEVHLNKGVSPIIASLDEMAASTLSLAEKVGNGVSNLIPNRIKAFKENIQQYDILINRQIEVGDMLGAIDIAHSLCNEIKNFCDDLLNYTINFELELKNALWEVLGEYAVGKM